jgi:murein L,D-transpeptidase YafK
MRNAVVILSALLAASCVAPADTGVRDTMPPAAHSGHLPVDRYGERAMPLRADFVLVDKSDRILVLYRGGKAFRAYRGLQFGDAPFGHKRFEGDERTPEGRYTIDTRNPQSAYHLSLRISYPNAADRRFAAGYGRSPGGDIFIHGQPNGMAGRMRGDWTDGCIALTNDEIEELWTLVPDGTPIEIRS